MLKMEIEPTEADREEIEFIQDQNPDHVFVGYVIKSALAGVAEDFFLMPKFDEDSDRMWWTAQLDEAHTFSSRIEAEQAVKDSKRSCTAIPLFESDDHLILCNANLGSESSIVVQGNSTVN